MIGNGLFQQAPRLSGRALECRALACWLAMREQGRASARLSKSRAAPERFRAGGV
jgi:hypothetical protein